MKINLDTTTAGKVLAAFKDSPDAELAAVARRIAAAQAGGPLRLVADELAALIVAVDEFVDYAEPSLEDHPADLVATTKAALATAKPKLEAMLDRAEGREA